METYIDFTKDLEVEATTITGVLPSDNVMHMHSSYELIYLPSGLETTVMAGNEVCQVDYPAIVIFAPFCMHFAYFTAIRNPERTRRVVLYVGDVFNRTMSEEVTSPEILSDGARMQIFDLRGKEDSFLRTLGMIVDMQTREKVRDRDPGMIPRLATGILLEQLRELTEEGTRTVSMREACGYIADVPLYILQHLSENLRTNDIAQAFFVSRDKLNKDFSAYMQTSVRKFIIALRLNKAKQMLQSGQCSARLITEQCGFENEIYFYTFFKKSVGMTPREYAGQYESGRRHPVGSEKAKK